MKYQAPKINTHSADEILGRLARHAAGRIPNPLVRAIVEEIQPEIDDALREHFGEHEIDLSRLNGGLTRVGRVMQRMHNRRTQQP